ncbi:hypothetical protein JHL17_19895 [Azospirillum sp. YIM B02556]|uniref:Uncharacterized protein n=1 Tax=Azospirillum endophyticum TaxID=2800326 RepID=A0ABS1F8E0_9PROT|nr:hypothetical protein [Azospirillum endophyticum]MBK1839677.1 hypothetical protein [Azospirillum endophyticum]
MTATDRNIIQNDRPPAPKTDPVARRLRRCHWMVLASAVLLLAGVLYAACRLTVLTRTTATTTAAADLWGPQFPAPSLPAVRSWRVARLLHLDAPRKKEPAETLAPAGASRVDPAVRLLVDQGWPGRPLAAIPAATRTAGIVAPAQKGSP